MKSQVNFQVQNGNKNLKKEPSLEDVILLLISILAENGIKNQINSENSLLFNVDGKEFELVFNEKENKNG